MLAPKLPKQGRIKPKYNPVPNAAEKRHEARLRDLPCYGCGGVAHELHHTMLPCPGKRFRRDHRFQLPLCVNCHRGPAGIHGIGNEAIWLHSVGRQVGETINYMARNWRRSQEAER